MLLANNLKKPICLALACSLLLSTSCTKKSTHSTEADTSIPEVSYAGTTQVNTTGSDGRLDIRSAISSRSESFDLTLQVAVRDQSGNPVPGAEVLYTQINEKIVLYVSDPSGQRIPALFVATPRELQAYFAGSLAGANDLGTARHAVGKTTVIPLLIGVLIILAAVTYSELQVIKHVYQINKFYLTDYVAEGNDYVMYCKSFEEIADLIVNRYSVVTGLTSIFVTYMTAGLTPLPTTGGAAALQFTKSSLSAGANAIRDALVNKAISEWGVSMAELTGRKVAVRIYPYDTHAAFSNVRNLFAVMALDYSDTRCQVQGNAISGTVSEAVTGNLISGVLVQLSGAAVRSTTTDANGSYSFPALPAGTFTITASKQGFITDTKTVTTNGSPVVANFVLSQTLPAGQIRFVLQWGANPHDLDGHLTGPVAGGSRFHMYWLYAPQYNRTNPWASIVGIDRDDTTGNGFETITLYQQMSGVYRYSVHDYSNASRTSSYALAGSGAQVSIYKESGLVRRFTVPTTSGGTLWTVFEMQGTTITAVNTLAYVQDPALVPKRAPGADDLLLFWNLPPKR